MVDREARDKMCTLIERWMTGQIGSFDFGDDTEDVAWESGDDAVYVVYLQLWFTYDDMKNHLYRPHKFTWDHIQRSLLLLRSDAQVEVLGSSETAVPGQDEGIEGVDPALLQPFNSIGELLAVRRSVPDFRKCRFDPSATATTKPAPKDTMTWGDVLTWVLMPVLLPLRLLDLLEPSAPVPDLSVHHRIILP